MFEWVKNDISKEEITSLMKPLDEKLMEAHTISKLITNRTIDPNVPEVKKEFIYSELEGLFWGLALEAFQIGLKHSTAIKSDCQHF